MFKRIFLFLICLIAPLMAYDQEKLTANMNAAWTLERSGQTRAAVALCSSWIDDPQIEVAEKVHYVATRSMMRGKNNEAWKADMELLKRLCEEDEAAYFECRRYEYCCGV